MEVKVNGNNESMLYFFAGQLMTKEKFDNLDKQLKKCLSSKDEKSENQIRDFLNSILDRTKEIQESMILELNEKLSFIRRFAHGRNGYFEHEDGFFFAQKISNINDRIDEAGERKILKKSIDAKQSLKKIGIIRTLSEFDKGVHWLFPTIAMILPQISIIPKEYFEQVNAYELTEDSTDLYDLKNNPTYFSHSGKIVSVSLILYKDEKK